MPTTKMSGTDRHLYLQQLAADPLDLVVIGGGITGAGIALDAATRGLRVGLIEKADFGGGTSSRSTKLIHGGLRYLKQGDLSLVREVGRERAVLHHNAPHIVIPERMLLPVIRGGTYGKVATSFGLWLYDLLAGVRRGERRYMLDKTSTLQAEPLLRDDGLLGGGMYYEYRTDDARLTIEVLKTATQYGAVCVNYAEAKELLYNADGKVCGASVVDQLSGNPYVVNAKTVVNAAGPWVDHVRTLDHSLQGKRLHHTKGVHIVLPRSRLPVRQSVYFDVPDGRMVFAIARFGTTYVGTTDTDYKGSLDQVYATTEDVDYLIRAVNSMFPSVHLQRDDVVSTWAGVRPLIHEDGKSPSELSRRDEILHSESGLITMAGGKLTGYRKMAERVVDLVMERLHNLDGRSVVNCRTDQIRLSGGDLERGSVDATIEKLTHTYASWGIDWDMWLRLVSRYGSNTERVVERVEAQDPLDTETDSLTDRLLRSEVVYGVTEEMVTSPSDFLVRRTGRLYFERPESSQVYPVVEAELMRQFRWNESVTQRHREAFTAESAAVVRFREEG